MFGDGALTLREFMAREPLPLATIQDAVLEFLRGRDDAALFGAQAVNAYVDEPRMTQDVDVLSPRARELARELRLYLSARFHIAVRVREVGHGRGFRLFQIRKPHNRHLVDLRQVQMLPPTRKVGGLRAVAPAELIAQKVIAFHRRRGRPKSGTDWRDLACLLLAFPELKKDRGAVRGCLEAAGVGPDVLAAWRDLATAEILPEDEREEF
jgi:hypothetical protein